MKKIYEATIDKYNFIMVDDNLIEVWVDVEDEYPMTYIVVDPTKVKTEKDFQKEISWWFMDKG